MQSQGTGNNINTSVASKPRPISLERSEMVQEITSNDPGFLVRWGNAFFLFIFVCIALACWFIRYPDNIQATARLTSINAPKPVISQMSGKLSKLCITEDQKVSKGQILGTIESLANYDEVVKLAISLNQIQDSLKGNVAPTLKHFSQNDFQQLGELQSLYQAFLQTLLSFQDYYTDGVYTIKRKLLIKDLDRLKELHTYLTQQKVLYEEDLSIAQKTFDANKILKQDDVISDFDYRLEKSKLINKKLALPQINALIVTNETQQSEKRKELMELTNLIDQQKLIFWQATNTLISQVDDWKRKYTIIAPIDGVVAFASFLQENQQLQADQVVCFVHPKSSQYFAEITIPQPNLGKVAIGQQVLLKFFSYPFNEYGSVEGRIEFISSIPTEKGYLAKANLTNGLNTTYQKEIYYRDDLLANAEIITEDMRLYERFYYSILKQIRK